MQDKINITQSSYKEPFNEDKFFKYLSIILGLIALVVIIEELLK